MGPNHVVADVRGVTAGCQGRGFWPVCDCQLVDGLHAHTCLHTPGGQVRPVRALPVFHSGVCDLSAVHSSVHPRDSRPLAGGNRKLFQDRTHVHHQSELFYCTAELKLIDQNVTIKHFYIFYFCFWGGMGCEFLTIIMFYSNYCQVKLISNMYSHMVKKQVTIYHLI